MNSYQKSFVALILSALNEIPANIPNDFDWHKALKDAERHRVSPIIYYGAFNSKNAVPKEVYDILEMSAFKSLAIDQRQLFAVTQIFEAFEKNEIHYMPLKGCLLKKLYPKTDMRVMVDADVLVKTEQYPKIKNIMSSLGYCETKESDHEYIWDKKGFFHLELHKRLIPSNNEDYYSYYGDGWKFAKKTGETYRYRLSNEDMFVYVFTHFAKHYRNGEIVLRNIIDLYILLKNNPDIRHSEYIRGEIEKLGLDKFYLNILDLIDVWFNDSPENYVVDFITDNIFGENRDKSLDRFFISITVQEMQKNNSASKAKRNKVLRSLFPKYSDMKIKYRFLKQVPILLPFMWAVRLVDAALFRRRDVKVRMEKLKQLDPESLNTYQKELETVGLTFNFKE